MFLIFLAIGSPLSARAGLFERLANQVACSAPGIAARIRGNTEMTLPQRFEHRLGRALTEFEVEQLHRLQSRLNPSGDGSTRPLRIPLWTSGPFPVEVLLSAGIRTLSIRHQLASPGNLEIVHRWLDQRLMSSRVREALDYLVDREVLTDTLSEYARWRVDVEGIAATANAPTETERFADASQRLEEAPGTDSSLALAAARISDILEIEENQETLWVRPTAMDAPLTSRRNRFWIESPSIFKGPLRQRGNA